MDITEFNDPDKVKHDDDRTILGDNIEQLYYYCTYPKQDIKNRGVDTIYEYRVNELPYEVCRTRDEVYGKETRDMELVTFCRENYEYQLYDEVVIIPSDEHLDDCELHNEQLRKLVAPFRSGGAVVRKTDHSVEIEGKEICICFHYSFSRRDF